MSDSRKKYEDLVEQGKAKPLESVVAGSGLSENSKSKFDYDGFIHSDIMKHYHTDGNTESNTSMSDYFVSRFLNWLGENYTIRKK